MTTLLQCIKEFIDNITVTNKQEENIKASVGALSEYLEKEEGNLSVKNTFTSGSYERDTILRPLDDIDVFVVLDLDQYQDGINMPNPQSVLSKIKNWLDKNADYEGKTSQDRPCITIQLSNKKFDIIPAFKDPYGNHYWIPNRDLTRWDITDPTRHTESLNDINRNRKSLVKSIVKAVKKWKRDLELNLPSYHVEEVAIEIFTSQDVVNIKDGIEKWFNYAHYYLNQSKFKSGDEFTKAKKKIKEVDELFIKAQQEVLAFREKDAILIWKNIFGTDFPSVTIEETKNMARSLTEGTLKISQTGILGVIGKTVPASKGFFGSEEI